MPLSSIPISGGGFGPESVAVLNRNHWLVCAGISGWFGPEYAQLFYFLQIASGLLTFYITVEVVNILFIIFEIKFELVNKEKDNSG